MSTNGADPHGPDRCVRVRGAREHNLRDVDVDIPRDAIVVFTGVSGSGKSSLAFGTLYAEAQRRYFESVAPYARRLLQQVGAPHVEEITGLPPAVALQQRRGAAELALVGRHDHDAVQPAADAATRAPATTRAGPTELDGRGVLAQHRGRRVPGVPRAGRRARRHRGAARPGPVAEHPRAARSPPGRARGRAPTCATSSSGSDIDIDKPWRRLTKQDRDWLLFTDEQPSVLIDPDETRPRRLHATTGSSGAPRKHVMHMLADSKSERDARAGAAVRRGRVPCPVCDGSGLRPEALAVTFAGRTIADGQRCRSPSSRRCCGRPPSWTKPGAAYLSPESGETTEVAVRICRGPGARGSRCSLDLGLGYLSLGRTLDDAVAR